MNDATDPRIAPTPAEDLSREQYDALNRLNWSRLHLLKKSPAHFKCGFGDSNASHFRLGTAAHAAVLEPEKFATGFVVYPKRRQGKAWEAFEQEALDAGKQVLSQREHDEATAIRNAVRRNVRANAYLSGGQAEVALTWTIDAGVARFDCKGRADFIGDAIVDLKSTRDASPRAFAHSCAKYGYFGQAAWYSDGYFLATGRRLPFVFVAVESDAPHIVTVFRVPDHVIDAGRDLYSSLLGKLDHCQRSGFWGGYTETEEVDLELPSFMAAQTEEQ
jgi:hypothetical protein